ncbi:MAG: regulatory protein RecX [Solirubrobacteraceae bacterium]
MSAAQGPAREARVEHALDLALRYLGPRDRTVAEVRARLERSEVREPALAEALARLEALGALDDDGFAARFAEDRRALDGWGAERIARRLRERGIERELAESVAAPAGGRDGELAAALAVLERRFPSPPGDARRERERAYGVLVRKGYDPELAADAVREHLRD